MNWLACSRSDAKSQQPQCLPSISNRRVMSAAAGMVLSILVLFGCLPAGVAWGHDPTGMKAAEVEEDAKGAAIVDIARALLAVDRLTVTQIAAILAALGQHNRDALQSLEGQLQQSAVDHGGPVLERWILASRDEALREGTAPIPAEMKAMLLGFFPESLLDRVRYRTGWGSKASLQGYVFGIGDTKGITLGEVILFRDAETAADPLIWAHELAHVQQYERWGTLQFAERYILGFANVEEEAWRVHGRYKSWAQRNGLMAQTDPATMWDR